MRRCVLIVAGCSCAGILTLAGCATEPPVQQSDPIGLTQVRSAIATGDLAEARSRLTRHEPDGLSDPLATLLQAEIDLRQGDALQALELAERVSETEQRARADEVAGKALIRLARFVEASERFKGARGVYRHPEDVSRVDDLIWLADGLQALEEGRPMDARALWSEIRSVTLRASIGREYETLTSASRESDDAYQLGGVE